MRKMGLTIKEHRAAGLEMKKIHLALLHLETVYYAAYPRKISPALLLADAIKAIAQVRCVAQSCLYRDHPKEADGKFYFGPVETNESEHDG